MRIAYICADPGVPVFGRKGCSIHVQEIIRAFRGLGAEMELFAASRGGESSPDLNDIEFHQFDMPPKSTPEEREFEALKTNEKLGEELRQVSPFDFVYERYSIWNYAGMEYAREVQIPGLLEINAPLIEEQAKYRVLINQGSAEQATARAFRAATALLAVSKEVARYVEGYEVAMGRIHVIPNGVNPDRFPINLRPSLPAAPGVFTVGFVGTLKPWHGLSMLIQVFTILHNRHPNTRLLIVGDGTERDNVVRELSDCGLLDSAYLTGAVPPDDVPGLLASMDVAVCPYPRQDFYFSPLKVYEYMAAGLPVVASRVGQLEELIIDGVTGLLVPPDCSEALAQALFRLYSDPGLRLKIGQAARAAVVSNHTWDDVARHILDIAGLKNAEVKY